MLFGSRVRHWGNRNIETEVVAGQCEKIASFCSFARSCGVHPALAVAG